MVKEAEQAKYLGVMLSRNESNRKDVTERLGKARKHFGPLHHFCRTQVAVLDPMMDYGMESASLTSQDLHRRSFPRPEIQENAPHPFYVLHRSHCTQHAHGHQPTTEGANLTAPTHTLHPPGRTQAVWTRFESTGAVFRKELLFH